MPLLSFVSPISPFPFSPISVERLFTAFRPVFALKVFHAALLQDPGVTFEQGKAQSVCEKTIRK